MHEDSPVILLTVYTYADGYRYKDEYQLPNVDAEQEINKKIFLHKMASEIVGFRAVSTFGVVKEWWGTSDKKDLWASAKDGGSANRPS